MQAPKEDCPWLVVDRANLSLLSAKVKSLGWVEQTALKRPTDKLETLVIFRPAQPFMTVPAEAAR
jgi:hypothetical protein